MHIYKMTHIGFIIRGKYNDILSRDIGDNTIINGWTFIGKSVHIGAHCMIGNFVEINSGAKIGHGTNIQPFCVINSDTEIGEYCHFGAGVMTADEIHMSPFTDMIKRKPCKIGSFVKVGQGSMLVSCEIGDHAVIGAGSLVLNDVPPGEVWFGSPAKFHRKRTAEEITNDTPK